MNEALIRLNDIPVYGFGILVVLSFLWGSFVFYKKAVESHFDDKIVLDVVVLAAFWGFIIGRLVFSIFNVSLFWNHWIRLFLLSNYPGLDRFGVLIGFAFGLWLCVRKVKGKFFDWFDLLSLGITAGVSVFFAGLGLFSFTWQMAVTAFLLLLGFVFFWRMEGRYRTIEWYKAGRSSSRSGFISGFLVSLWGAVYFIEVLLTKTLDLRSSLWSAALFVGGFVIVYIRSGRTLQEEFRNILKNGKK